MEAQPESLSEVHRIFESQKSAWRSQGPPPAARRIEQLRNLRRALTLRADEIERAVAADIRKPPAEVSLTEILVVAAEIEHAQRNLRRWMRPARVSAGLSFPGARAEIRREPKGVCLVVSPWNFPFQLALGPLVSAIAAGNRVILKPSELAPATSALLRSFLAELFDESEVAVAEGDSRVGAALLELPFDHVFFTGSTAIGRKVLEAASRHLTPVTLELGGKCPALIHASARLQEAAEKIAWGKFINAGQTCVAPDYVLLPESKLEEFAGHLRAALHRLFGPPERRRRNPDYGRLVDARHFDRVRRLLEEAVAAGASVIEGGELDAAENFVSPTVLTRVPPGCAILREEIFGPLLPLLPYASDSEAIERVNALPPPLAVYLFARRPEWVERCLRAIPAGDALVNDVVVHFANPRLPFGGLRASGLGKSHGEAGFRAFSHDRAVMRQPRLTVMRWLGPPYTPAVRRRIRWVTRWFAGL